MGGYTEVLLIINYITLPLILQWIRVKLLSGMRVFVQHGIIIYQNWTIYTYLDLVLKETTTHIPYKPPHF